MLLSNLSGKTVDVRITNLTDKDAQFLRSLLSIFTDPQKARMAAELRTGRLALQYSPEDGSLAWMDLASDCVPTPAEMIQFVARFQDWEWDQLAARPGFKAALYRSLSDAEEIAKEVLGYLPDEVRLDVVRGKELAAKEHKKHKEKEYVRLH